MGSLKGSCLCRAVTFSVAGPIRGVGQCHCSQCRKVSGTGGNANFIVDLDKFSWLSGENHTVAFALPSGWSVVRCATCGSPLPNCIDGERVWVTAGLMDDPLDTNIKMHIFCASRADWDEESGSARQYERYPD